MKEIDANAPCIQNLTVHPCSSPCCFWKRVVFSLRLWFEIVLEQFEWLLMGSEMDFSPKSSKMPWLRMLTSFMSHEVSAHDLSPTGNTVLSFRK